MPVRAPKPCAQPACPTLIAASQRYCVDHQRKVWAGQAQARREDPERHALDRQYRSTRWRKYATWFVRHHPLCAECERQGETTASSLVDHIVPTVSGGAFWEPDNHQALCDPCHRVKSAPETFGRAKGVGVGVP